MHTGQTAMEDDPTPRDPDVPSSFQATDERKGYHQAEEGTSSPRRKQKELGVETQKEEPPKRRREEGSRSRSSERRRSRRDDSRSRSRGERRRRSSSRERRRRRSTSPSRSGSRRRDRRYSDRSDSRSRRDRSRDRSRDRGRRRSRDRSPPHRRKGPAKPVAYPNRFWDGFRWIERAAPDPTALATTLNQTRAERRLYVGNLPPGITSQELRAFFDAAVKPLTGEEDAVLTVWMAPDGKFGFIEMSTIEGAQCTLQLNGTTFLGKTVKVARPNSNS